ncbi:MAG: serine/threonine-protein kinase, partial [Actinomycetota bacterium]
MNGGTWTVDIAGVEPVRYLGAGGFGQVWLGRQPSLDRLVAVKIGHRPLIDRDEQRRFERECLALGRLSGHPNIVDVHTSGLDNGVPYLVLEYIDGGTVADRAAWYETSLVRLGVDLATAVGAAHAIGVLHRDLKPENVLLRADGAAVLGDFGIARIGDGNHTSAPGITASLAFAAPEILNGAPPSEGADIYGIGITMAAAVIGHSPFARRGGITAEALVTAVLGGAAPNLRPYGVSDRLTGVIQRAMDVDPSRRPASAAALIQELRAVDRPTPVPSADDTVRAPVGGRIPATGASTMAAAAAATPTTAAPHADPRRTAAPPVERSAVASREAPRSTSAGRRPGFGTGLVVIMAIVVLATVAALALPDLLAPAPLALLPLATVGGDRGVSAALGRGVLTDRGLRGTTARTGWGEQIGEG